VKEVALWIVAGLLFAVFIAANCVNASIIFGRRHTDETRASSSPILFVGGIVGAVACATAPHRVLNAYFWLPPLVDLGTVPYLLLAACVMVWEGLKSGALLRRIPFLRYLAKPAPAPPRAPSPNERAIIGCILGTAVGDAMGLASEGLSRRRQLKFFPELRGYHLLFGKGMCSDDTEHTCMLAQSLIETGGYPSDLVASKFASNFAWRLRFWLLGLPAGIGLATLRAILKLWVGIPPRWSGVYSAGNAPAMRSALIGVCYGDDTDKMCTLVRAATRITHTDPKAEYGALAVALAAHLGATRAGNIEPAEFLREICTLVTDPEFRNLMTSVTNSVERGETAENFAGRIDCTDGVSGYIYRTVPAVLHVWLAHQKDFRGAIVTIIRLGGDTDTTAAIVGAIVGAQVGKSGIPSEWLDDLWEWPRTVTWMERLGTRLAEHGRFAIGGGEPLSLFKLLVRNLLFIVLVLLHGFRRLLPPY